MISLLAAWADCAVRESTRALARKLAAPGSRASPTIAHCHRRASFNASPKIKKPREQSEANGRALSREERQRVAYLEGVLTFGLPLGARRPITVAGPWPIFTAFPLTRSAQIVEGESKLRAPPGSMSHSERSCPN